MAAAWLALASGGGFQAQPEEPAGEVPEPANNQPRERVDPFRIPRAASEIKVDGILDDDAWRQALRLDLPYEVWPGDNNDAMVRTEAYLIYDTSHIYAAFKAHDPEPDRIRARLSDRDTAFADDFVGLVLDTFNSERRAFEFFVNAKGVQMDLVQDDVAGREDSSWDAIWDSAGRVTGEGYVVELAIPYTSLRFQRQDGDQVWGLDLIRIYPRDKRFLMASNRRNRDVSCYLCQVGKIVGFEGATPGRNLEIAPTVTALRTDAAPDELFLANPGDPNSWTAKRFSERSVKTGEAEFDPGITAKWGMTPNLTLAGTLNPDFSQVEADTARLDVNERFALFFPEKRPFFLEGDDFFRTPFNAVHTRTVADPKWGTKITGKEGKNAIGAFVAEDEFTTVLFPGPQGSSATTFEDSVTDGVFRYRRDVGKNSALGGLLTVREGNGNDYFNRVAGADALLRFTQKDTLRVQVLGSQTRYPEEHPDDPNGTIIVAPSDPGDSRSSFDQPRGDFSDAAHTLHYSHNTKGWDTWFTHSQSGSDFRSDLGFIPQVGTRFTLAGSDYTWWGEEGQDWYSHLTVGGDVDEQAELGGRLIERELELWVSWASARQSHFFLGGGTRRFQFLEGRFAQPFVNLWYELRPTKDLWAGLSSGISKRVDFSFEDPNDSSATRQGDEFRIGPELTYRLGSRLRLGASTEMRQLRIDRGRLFRAMLTQLSVTYNLSLRSFFRGIFQYSDVNRDTDLYPACVTDPSGCGLEKETQSFFTQLLFSYKVNPQTAVFVGYTENQRGGTDVDLGERIDLTRQDRTLFFKIGYAFVQ